MQSVPSTQRLACNAPLRTIGGMARNRRRKKATPKRQSNSNPKKAFAWLDCPTDACSALNEDEPVVCALCGREPAVRGELRHAIIAACLPVAAFLIWWAYCAVTAKG